MSKIKLALFYVLILAVNCARSFPLLGPSTCSIVHTIENRLNKTIYVVTQYQSNFNKANKMITVPAKTTQKWDMGNHKATAAFEIYELNTDGSRTGRSTMYARHDAKSASCPYYEFYVDEAGPKGIQAQTIPSLLDKAIAAGNKLGQFMDSANKKKEQMQKINSDIKGLTQDVNAL